MVARDPKAAPHARRRMRLGDEQAGKGQERKAEDTAPYQGRLHRPRF